MQLTLATHDDIPALKALIRRSAEALCIKDYSADEVEAALQGAWAVDTVLIDDQTYFIAKEGETIIGCGGWSKRATLFGGNTFESRDPALLNPKTDRAKIRAFFVDPGFVGHDVGLKILHHCESEARKAGFKKLELMATLTGARFYRRNGYEGTERTTVNVYEDASVDFIPMIKDT